MDTYHVTAQNFSSETENKIHNDEIAKRYGFTGALVPGVAVYGHLTYPLVAALGEQWLTHAISSVRFFKPAYDGDSLTIEAEKAGAETLVHARNAAGVELAQLRTERPQTLPTVESFERQSGDSGVPYATDEADRVAMTWASVVPDMPYRPWEITLDADTNQRYCQRIRDDLPIYEQFVHPHWLLGLANTALTREYIMPAWIHTGSEIRHRAAVKVGDTITVRALPLEKWRKNGHEFIRLYLNYCRNDTLTTEIFHTAIFKVAE